MTTELSSATRHPHPLRQLRYGLITLGLVSTFMPLLLSEMVDGGRSHHVHPILGIAPVLGLVSMYTGLQLTRKNRISLYLAIIVSTLIAESHFRHYLILREWPLLVPFILALGCILLATRLIPHFATQLPTSRSLIVFFRSALVITLVGFVYGTAVFALFGKPLFHQTFSLIDSVRYAINEIGLPGSAFDTPTRSARLFLASLNGIGIVIALSFLRIFTAPLHIEEQTDRLLRRRRAQQILRTHSTSSEDFFTIWPNDKDYFFSEDGKAYIAYGTGGRYRIAFQGLSGDPTQGRSCIEQFVRESVRAGWSVAAINVDASTKTMYENLGLRSIYIGGEAVVRVDRFLEITIRNKHFRYVRNKSEKLGLHVQEWKSLTNAQIAQLRTISDAWLSEGDRREYGFIMGYFNDAYLRQSRVFVLMDGTDPVAYLNLIPTYHSSLASIDQFRSSSRMPAIGMHYLFMRVLEELGKEGYTSLNLGLAPLSRISKGVEDERRITRAALKLIRRFGNRYYSFRGVEQFKGKFEPDWEPRYIVYTGQMTDLPSVMSAVNTLTMYKRPRLSAPQLLALAASIALVAFVIFVATS